MWVEKESRIPQLTKDIIARSRVIARGRGIRDLRRLLQEYGGKPALWVKKSGPPIEIEGEMCEYHWYEHEGIGRFEIKKKVSSHDR